MDLTGQGGSPASLSLPPLAILKFQGTSPVQEFLPGTNNKFQFDAFPPTFANGFSIDTGTNDILIEQTGIYYAEISVRANILVAGDRYDMNFRVTNGVSNISGPIVSARDDDYSTVGSLFEINREAPDLPARFSLHFDRVGGAGNVVLISANFSIFRVGDFITAPR